MAWGPELFHPSAAGGVGCPRAIDITGRARILLFGPFIPLPPGCWSVQVDFEVCDEAARYPFLVEFGTVDDFSGESVPARAPARRSVRLEHTLRQTAPVEVRLWVSRAAFHGEVRFLGAQIERRDAGPQQEPISP
jgi:hypothetical protein